MMLEKNDIGIFCFLVIIYCDYETYRNFYQFT